eukprot:scaffold577678_cov17-Prasinocladus_malaysianus.AAC.1
MDAVKKMESARKSLPMLPPALNAAPVSSRPNSFLGPLIVKPDFMTRPGAVMSSVSFVLLFVHTSMFGNLHLIIGPTQHISVHRIGGGGGGGGGGDVNAEVVIVAAGFAASGVLAMLLLLMPRLLLRWHIKPGFCIPLSQQPLTVYIILLITIITVA